jgi:hypothetical protein
MADVVEIALWELTERRKALEQVDDDTLKRLDLYARKQLYGPRKRWRGAHGGHPPGGIESGDLVQEAFSKFLAGKCTWDPAKQNLLRVLENIISRDANHLATGAENRRTLLATMVREESGGDREDISSLPSLLSEDSERLLVEKEQRRRILSLFPPETDVRAVVDTIFDGKGFKRREITEEANMSPKRFDNARRTIRRVLERDPIITLNLKATVKS